MTQVSGGLTKLCFPVLALPRADIKHDPLRQVRMQRLMPRLRLTNGFQSSGAEV